MRVYHPEAYPVKHAHHYTYGGFMDTWELYRFSTSPEGVEYLAASLNLSLWRPSLNFHSSSRGRHLTGGIPRSCLRRPSTVAPKGRQTDGHHYDLLYSAESGTAYLIRFDG